MLTISQLLKHLEPPYLEVGNITTGADKWEISFDPFKDDKHTNGYKVNFKIPWDSETKALKGPQGDKGTNATFKIGTVKAGATPSVTNSGTTTNAVLNFVLPNGIKGDKGEQGFKGETGAKGDKGDKGDKGKPAFVKIGNVTVAGDGLVHVQARDQEFTDRVETFLDFYFPQAILTGGKGMNGAKGDKGDPGVSPTINIGTVTKGTAASVTNSGTTTNAVLDFVLPQGNKGDKGDKGDPGTTPTFTIGTVVEGATPSVTNSGTATDIVLNFVLPNSAPSTGTNTTVTPTTITIGKVKKGSIPTVKNVGTSTAAILDFTLPEVPTSESVTSLDASKIIFTDKKNLQAKLNDNTLYNPTAITSLSASKIVFTDEQSLQTKFNNKSLGTSIFQKAIKVTTLAAGKSASGTVTGAGSSADPYVLNLSIPKGDKGDAGAAGAAGAAATIKMGKVTQTGSKVTIVNSGTQNAAVLDFNFPASWGGSSSTNSLAGLECTKTKVELTAPLFAPSAAGNGTLGNASLPFGTGFFQHLVMSGVSMRQKQIFTISDNFVVPAGVNLLWISGCAGGAGGSAGIGGGGGESIFRQPFQVTAGSTIKITIGAGGQGFGSLSDILSGETSFDKGKVGGNTIIGNLITLRGGKVGVFTPSSKKITQAAAGGSGSTTGGIMQLLSVSGNLSSWRGGEGGSSLYGTGGPGGYFTTLFSSQTSSYVNGSSGIGFGSGGGGGGVMWGGSSTAWWLTTAGSGAPGIVIIEWE